MILLDFTVAKYEELCSAISNSDFVTLTVNEYFLEINPDKFIILRHDVDIKPERSLKIAEIENAFGICATYYFRMIPKVFDPVIIKQIRSLGHEIGYHYEVLDKVKGDYEKALKLFRKELLEFRKVCDVNTICMHGNPLTKWSNRDLWKYYDFKEFGILGEAYLSINYNDVVYFTDTGRTWAGEKYRVKDFVDTSLISVKVKYTDAIIKLINEGEVKHLCILMHPGQWDDDFGSWLKTWTLRKIKNVLKAGIVWYRKVKGNYESLF